MVQNAGDFWVPLDQKIPGRYLSGIFTFSCALRSFELPQFLPGTVTSIGLEVKFIVVYGQECRVRIAGFVDIGRPAGSGPVELPQFEA